MKLFIGCSSSTSVDEQYVEETSSIANELSSGNIELILSGNWSSLNGACYESFVRNHKKVTVVTDEIRKKAVDEMDDANSAILPNTFRCSESIYNKSDMLLFLPGGIDITAILWASLKENTMKKIPKPIIIYNMNGYYNTLIAYMEQMLLEQFEPGIVREYYHVFQEREELLKYMSSYNKEKVFKI